MRRKLASLVAVLALLLVAVPAGHASAATVSHWTASGPWATAFWTTAPESPKRNVVYTDTFLGVYHQLNGPGSQGYFSAGFVDQVTYKYDRDWNWVQLSETYADDFAMSVVAFTQPLIRAYGHGSGALVTCSYWAAPDCVPAGTVTVEAWWTGTGPISRSSTFDLTVDPALAIHISGGPEAIRAATVSPNDPFAGGMGDLGALVGHRMGDVHLAFIDVCHQGGC